MNAGIVYLESNFFYNPDGWKEFSADIRIKKGKKALFGNPSQSYGASPAIWDNAVLPSPGTGERTPPEPQPCRPVLDLPTPEGWKAELMLMVGCVLYVLCNYIYHMVQMSRLMTEMACCRWLILAVVVATWAVICH